MTDHNTLFNIQGSTAVLTGGSGVLGRTMAQALASAGARVAILSLHAESAEKSAATIREQGGKAIGIACDVTQRASLEDAQARVRATLGEVDILVNAAGGNQAGATVGNDHTFFELDAQAINNVITLNLQGTVLSCQVFGQGMAQRHKGSIVNITSMAAIRPLTRVTAYAAAKAAIVNFTQWLAVYMAQEYGPDIRVNAIAPGFFLTEQNRFLMLEQDGSLTARGNAIVTHTPAGRLGDPSDLSGTLLWLVSPGAAFVTGIVVPVDGGFSAFGGV